MNCEWEVDYSGIVKDWEPVPVFEQMAIQMLSQWTGNRFGVCREVIRPYRYRRYSRPSTFDGRGPIFTGRPGPWKPVILASGQWGNVDCFICPLRRCSCTSTSIITLPGPIQSIEEVRIDGEVLPESDYRVDNRRMLVRLDGKGWPATQDMDADPLSDENTFQVTYSRGTPVPIGGQVAAGVLAYELFLASKGDPECGLPQRVQTVSRQGVTVAVLDQFDDVDEGHTGIWLIDSWVASVTKAPQRASVYSPDLPRVLNRRQTWPSM